MRTGTVIFALLLIPVTETVAQVQLSTSRQRPGLLALGSVSISASPGTVSFNLVNGGTSDGSSAVSVNTSWLLLLGTSINVFAYFNTPTAALSGPANIPSSRVYGQVPGGVPTAFTPFTQTNALGPAGGGLLLVTIPSGLISLNLPGSRAASLSLRIDLTGASLPAGTYTGTLVVQAQAL